MKQGQTPGGRVEVHRAAFCLASVMLMSLIAVVNHSWACVPQPLLTILPSSSGPPGSEVTLEGLHLGGRVEIRWNTIDGPLLATVTDSPFSVKATIPEASEGLYALVAFERDPAGGIVGVTRSAFEITTDDRRGSPNAAPSLTVQPERAVQQDRTSPSTVLAAGLGAVGGVILLLSGAVLGARITRHRGQRSAPPSNSPSDSR